MLASTVQFSTYNQTPARLSRQTCPTPQGEQRYDRRSALKRRNGRPLSQDPTACLQPAHSRHPVPHPSEDGPYLGQQQLPAELVSVPPSSTTPGACSPPRL